MALKFAAATRNARLQAIIDQLGSDPILELWSGTEPANVAAVDAPDGAIIASIQLPTTPFNTPGSGAMTLAGTWRDLSADAAGTVSHFRMTTSGGVVILQGTVGVGQEMTLDDYAPEVGESITITACTITDGNA